MAITHADRKTDNTIPPIEDKEIVDEIKKEPVTNNTKQDVDLEKADTPQALWESFLERRKGAPTAIQTGGNPEMANQHSSGMDKDWNRPVKEQTYIRTNSKESKENE
jgi:hypothetical protein